MTENSSFGFSPRTKGKRNSFLQSDCSLKDFVEATYSKEPPQLEDFFVDFPELTKLAEMIQNELHNGEDGEMDTTTLELGIRHLFNEFLNANGRNGSQSMSVVDYSSLLARNPNDANIANLQITELRRQITALKSDLESQKRETKAAQRDLDSMIAKNAKLNKEKEDLKVKQIREVTDLKHEIESIHDQQTAQNDQFRYKNEEIQSMKKQLKDVEDELEISQRENQAYKERLDKKNQQINELRMKIQTGNIQYEELQRAKTESEMTLSSQMIQERGIQENHTRKEITKMVKQNKRQAKELSAVIEANHRAAELIEQHEQTINEFADREITFNEDLESAQEEIAELKQQIEDTTTKNDELTSLLESRTEELTELRSVVSDCLDALAPKYSTTAEGLPEVVHELASTRIDPETRKTLGKLQAIVDGLTRFVVQLVRTGNADISLLQNSQKPIVEDGTMKLDILNEVAAIREEISDIAFSSAEEDPVMAFLNGIEENVELNDQEEFSPSSVIAAVCAKCREFTKHEISELVKVRKVLPFVCSDAELPTAVAEYLLELQPVFQQLLDILSTTLHYHGNTEDIFKCLCKYVEETSNMINELDENVRPLIGFSGKITSIPSVIAEALTDMKQQIDDYSRGVSKEVTQSMIQADKDKSKFKRKIDELNSIVQRNQYVIDTLQTQLDKTSSQLQESQTSCEDVSGRNQDAEKTISELKDTNAALEETKEFLLSERERMEERFMKQQEQHTARLEQAIDNQRKLNEEELERQKKKYENEIQELSVRMAKTAKKLQVEKKRSQEKTDLYNELSRRTSEEIRNLVSEKSDLASQLEVGNKLQKKVTKLQTKLNDERTRSIELEETISRLSAPASPRSPTGQSPFSQHSSRPVSREASPKQSPVQSPRQSPRFSATSPKRGDGQSYTMSREIAASSEVTSPRRADLDSFIQQIGEQLDKFMKKEINWNRKRIVSTITAIVDRISVLEAELKQRNTASTRVQQLQADWALWADQLLHKYSRNYRSGMTENEMRCKISDVVGMAQQRKMLDVIDSLREQKKILVNGLDNVEEGEKKEATMADLSKVGMFIAATHKSANEPKSPSKSVVAKQKKSGTNTSLSFN